MRDASAIPESDTRAAVLAVSRYGIALTQVQRALEAVQDARAQGKPAQILEHLVNERQLTAEQAAALRSEMSQPAPDVTVVAAFPFGASVTSASKTPTQEAEEARRETPAPAPLRKIGEFRLLRRLGEGGMGEVYLGYQEGLNRQVAVKILSDALTHNRPYIDRFQREARSGLVLNHPNIVRCFGAGQDAKTGRYFLVLEFVDGPNARALLEQFGRLSVGDAVHIAIDIARALEHIHGHNYVHRDIKPDNIFVTRSGLAKLGDLGLAKKIDDSSHLTAARQGVGTPYYMPYEQIISARQVDGRSDIYALGATLYHLLTGEVPFPGKTALETAERKILGTFLPASSLNPTVPAALDEILEKMMALRPNDRYQTASEFIVEMERTGLASVVPSFVDAEAALRDPHVRARLTPAQPTKAEITVRVERAPRKDPPAGGWLLRYRGPDGKKRTRPASTAQLLRDWRAGRLPEGAEIRRPNKGAFKPLTAYREFGMALAGGQTTANGPCTEIPTGKSPQTGPRSRRWLLLGVGIGVAAVAITLGLIFFLPG